MDIKTQFEYYEHLVLLAKKYNAIRRQTLAGTMSWSEGLDALHEMEATCKDSAERLACTTGIIHMK
jgi:hypothetical protein